MVTSITARTSTAANPADHPPGTGGSAVNKAFSAMLAEFMHPNVAVAGGGELKEAKHRRRQAQAIPLPVLEEGAAAGAAVGAWLLNRARDTLNPPHALPRHVPIDNTKERPIKGFGFNPNKEKVLHYITCDVTVGPVRPTVVRHNETATQAISAHLYGPGAAWAQYSFNTYSRDAHAPIRWHLSTGVGDHPRTQYVHKWNWGPTGTKIDQEVEGGGDVIFRRPDGVTCEAKNAQEFSVELHPPPH